MFKIVSPKVYFYFLFDKITLAVFLAFLGRFAATFCKLLGFSNLKDPFTDPDSFGAHLGMLGMASLASTDCQFHCCELTLPLSWPILDSFLVNVDNPIPKDYFGLVSTHLFKQKLWPLTIDPHGKFLG
jgi:prepilin signal peptidase PulO-like enzyme (type II secretory pathway)